MGEEKGEERQCVIWQHHQAAHTESQGTRGWGRKAEFHRHHLERLRQAEHTQYSICFYQVEEDREGLRAYECDREGDGEKERQCESGEFKHFSETIHVHAFVHVSEREVSGS